ncbi:endonuclease domain-containing 1 protein-like [Hemiscyllium ocellatum]|uniref:endonuclease domain-containing 1 protein-like n=1 Tax=Hemiscyllium ocellatum TaxID=170820 RepID=UPI0029668028|nr:endonuclease domain-containing 1 protein-like [Hemiscyllium ocellatum]
MAPRAWFALLSVLGSVPLLLADVTDHFHHPAGCQQFFYQGQPPSGFVGFSQTRLCQRLDGRLYFATLYDRSAHLPVYSAFRFKYRAEGVPRGNGTDTSWKYERQLVDPLSDGNMTLLTPAALRDPAVRRSQAADGAYPLLVGGVRYVRGQLNPANLQGSRGSRSATYTLTNAVPYPRPFHQAGWRPVLREMAARVRRECGSSPAFLVSGAARQARGKELWVPSRGKGRSAVPQLLWMAFCCGPGGASGAAVGHPRGTGRLALGPLGELGPYETREVSLRQLESALAIQMGRSSVHIYKGGCRQPASGN